MVTGTSEKQIRETSAPYCAPSIGEAKRSNVKFLSRACASHVIRREDGRAYELLNETSLAEGRMIERLQVA